MKFGCIACVFAALFFSSPAAAKKDAAVPMKPDIAAVVGQEVISTYDLDNRIKFIITSSNLSNTPETAARLRPQVIRALIDEKIERAEAAKNDIKISEEEAEAAIAGIEKERNLPPNAAFDLLARNNLPKETFTGQIRAQLAWRKLVLKKLRPLVHVTDEEVKFAQSAPHPSGMPKEIKIAVLTLPVDKRGREQEVSATAQKLARELRSGGSFEEVTRQLSQHSAKGSDEAFWVRPDQLDPTLARALSAAAAGAIIGPVRSEAGYVLVKIYDLRSAEIELPKESEVEIKEILLKVKTGAPPQEGEALLSIAQEMEAHPGTCEEKGVAGIESVKDADIQVSHRRAMMSELPQDMQVIVEGLKPGQISAPVQSSEGIRLTMLCDRKEQAASDAEIERIKNQIYQKKIELEAEKYLRNLRRDTFIEIR
jgi:peptidyl-prolyl cis-trans isomerase SurA